MISEHDDQVSRERDKSENLADAVPALPRWEPQCIYFYYLVPVDDHHADLVGFVVDKKRTIVESEIDQLVDNLVVQARTRVYTDATPTAHFFEDIAWVRQSYIAIVVDHARYTLSPGDIDIEGSSHTIFSETPLLLTGTTATGVRYRNYVIRAGGQVWGKKKEEREKFKIKMKFQVRAGLADPKAMSHDDSSTNLGPPLPPP